jgi:phage terminase large subunit-like protein
MREHERRDRVPYGLWREQGLVTATPGNVIDYDRIYRDIKQLAEAFPRLWGAPIGYDPAFATDLAVRLQAAGFTMVEVLQNYKHLSEPSHVFEAFVKGKRVRHTGHKVLRWNMENVAVRQDDAGRIRPVKPRKKTKRIDGVVAGLMGLSGALLSPDDGGISGDLVVV